MGESPMIPRENPRMRTCHCEGGTTEAISQGVLVIASGYEPSNLLGSKLVSPPPDCFAPSHIPSQVLAVTFDFSHFDFY